MTRSTRRKGLNLDIEKHLRRSELKATQAQVWLALARGLGGQGDRYGHAGTSSASAQQARVCAAGQAQSDGRSGSRSSRGAGPASRLAPLLPGRSCAAVAAAVAEGPAAARVGPGARCLGDASSWPTLTTGDKAMTPKPRGRGKGA
jgi:hypothetical protein